MSLLDRVIKNLKGEKSEKAPEGVCANCWGHFEYGGEIRKKMRYRRYTPDDTDGRAFIEEFVVKHITGIELVKTEDGMGRCALCEELSKI